MSNILLSLLPSSWRFYKYLYKESRNFSFLLFKFLVIFGVLLLPLIVRFSGFPNKTLLINNHEIYFSEISLEIINADYASRLRIADSYPAEWSTYGFFAGSANSIPLAFLQEVTVFDVFLGKIVLLAFLVLLITQQIPRKSRKLVYLSLLSLLFFAGQLQFGLVGYHIFTILLLLMNVIAFKRYRYFENCLLSLALALSHPRAVFVGLGFMIFYSISLVKSRAVGMEARQLKRKIAENLSFVIFFNLYLIALASTFLSGKSSPEQSAFAVSPIKNVIESRQPFDFVENVLAIWFAPPWQLPFGLGTYAEAHFPNFEAFDDVRHYLILFILYYVVLLMVNFSRVLQSDAGSHQRRIQSLYGIVLVSIGMYLLLDYFIVPDTPKFIFFRQFCLLTVLPVIALSIAMTQKDNALKSVLLFSTLIPCTFTNAGIWAPMFMSLEIVTLYFLWEYLLRYKTFLHKLGKFALSFLTILLILWSPVRIFDLMNANTRDVYTHEIDFSELPMIYDVACSNIDNRKLMALSFLGVRVAYDASRPETYAVSRRFAIANSIKAHPCANLRNLKT
jgi:hypothetical protein